MKKGHLNTETRTQGESHVQMKAEIEVMPKSRNAKDCQNLGEKPGTDFPLRRDPPCQYIDLRLLDFRTMRQQISVV